MCYQNVSRDGHPVMICSTAAVAPSAAAARSHSGNTSADFKNATSTSAARTTTMAFTSSPTTTKKTQPRTVTSASTTTAATTGSAVVVNPIWRLKVTQWCYDYMDCISERRTVVYIAMNILDRYCGAVRAANSNNNAVDHAHYQVAALAATYLAIRIAGGSNNKEEHQQATQLSDLVAMSRGKISQGEIVAMGTKIVKALSWDKRMETPTEWVHRSFDRLPQDHHGNSNEVIEDSTVRRTRRRLIETANFMVEVAIFDADLCDLPPRVLAAAAVLRVVPPHQVPALVAHLRVDHVDPKIVQEASHRLGMFVKESLRTTSLAAFPRPEPAAAEALAAPVGPHVIEADDDLSVMEPLNTERPVYINGFALIPDDDEDDAMDESD
jgi:hypothetical protein